MLDRCLNCNFHDFKNIKYVEAFDVPDKRMTITDTIDYCRSLDDKCNPDICEYRIIEISAIHLEAIKQLLVKHLTRKEEKKSIFKKAGFENIGLETAVECLDKILEV
jgi:hypothetical protein